MMNVGNPSWPSTSPAAQRGRRLARLEFIINNNIGVHPKAILDYPTSMPT